MRWQNNSHADVEWQPTKQDAPKIEIQFNHIKWLWWMEIRLYCKSGRLKQFCVCSRMPRAVYSNGQRIYTHMEYSFHRCKFDDSASRSVPLLISRQLKILLSKIAQWSMWKKFLFSWNFYVFACWYAYYCIKAYTGGKCRKHIYVYTLMVRHEALYVALCNDSRSKHAAAIGLSRIAEKTSSDWFENSPKSLVGTTESLEVRHSAMHAHIIVFIMKMKKEKRQRKFFIPRNSYIRYLLYWKREYKQRASERGPS